MLIPKDNSNVVPWDKCCPDEHKLTVTRMYCNMLFFTCIYSSFVELDATINCNFQTRIKIRFSTVVLRISSRQVVKNIIGVEFIN